MPDMPRLDTLGQRLKFIRQLRKLTQMQLADQARVQQSDVSKLERGDSLSTTNLAAIAHVLRVRPLWLDKGDGPMEDVPSKRSVAKTDDADEAIGSLPALQFETDDVVIRQYETGGSMGKGVVLADQPGVIKEWRVSEQWAQQNVHRITALKNLAIVTGFGPSMQPLFNPGDPLLVDRGVTRADVDGVYFFRVGEEGFVKQLQRIPTAKGLVLRAKSYNTLYDPFDITEGMDFEVFARVVKVWKGEEF